MPKGCRCHATSLIHRPNPIPARFYSMLTPAYPVRTSNNTCQNERVFSKQHAKEQSCRTRHLHKSLLIRPLPFTTQDGPQLVITIISNNHKNKNMNTILGFALLLLVMLLPLVKKSRGRLKSK